MYSEDAVRAQGEALARFENQEARRASDEHIQELEKAAIAAAIASSEYEAAEKRAMEEALLIQSEEVAAEMDRVERAAADEELAMVIESSEREAQADKASIALTTLALGVKRARTEERNEGVWDCENCTYTNRPYSRTCGMCKSAAPRSVLTFMEISELRFGLEIEIIVPDGKRDGYTLESIAKDLTRLGPRVDFVGYSHNTNEYWKIVTDSSLQGQNGHDRDLCFELVSPVLQGDGITGLGSLRAVMENVRRLGIATNASCGFHVHVDATRDQNHAVAEMGTVDGLKRVAQCFVSLENAFDLLVARTWDSEHVACGRRANRNKYCRSNRLAFGALSNRQRWEKIGGAQTRKEVVDMVNPQENRYMKLNLTNISNPSRPSTCEFRHHGGVEELREAEAWVRLVLRFCEKASQRCAASDACLLHERAAPREELKALFALVDCEGLEQFFVVERRLFADHQLDNDWECRVCSRKFVNSRALSQHSVSTGHRLR